MTAIDATGAEVNTIDTNDTTVSLSVATGRIKPVSNLIDSCTSPKVSEVREGGITSFPNLLKTHC